MDYGLSVPFKNAGRMGPGILILLFGLNLTVWGQVEQPSPPTASRAPSTTQEHMSSLPLPPPQTVLVKGRKIVYYEAGQGSVVILIHGLGADSHHWGYNIEPLSHTFRVIALDQIGYGKSDKPVMRYTVGNFADYLHGFMEAVKISKASLVGNSLGGWVALDFTIRHPDMVEKLVLVDAAGLHPATPLRKPKGGLKNLTPFNTRWFFDLMDANKEWATTDLGPQGFERHVKNGDSYTVASSVAEMATGREFEDKKLVKVHTPTLIIWGSNDMLIPLAMGEHFNKGIVGSQLIVIDGTGHIPMVGKPVEFDDAVQKFLSPS
ncbi:MAG TPA: alpha/beta hydrolase [Terriglobia bacterium]|nr:alpha/beta hydrolase [Terriglobia bacterium]